MRLLEKMTGYEKRNDEQLFASSAKKKIWDSPPKAVSHSSQHQPPQEFYERVASMTDLVKKTQEYFVHWNAHEDVGPLFAEDGSLRDWDVSGTAPFLFSWEGAARRCPGLSVYRGRPGIFVWDLDARACRCPGEGPLPKGRGRPLAAGRWQSNFAVRPRASCLVSLPPSLVPFTDRNPGLSWTRYGLVTLPKQLFGALGGF